MDGKRAGGSRSECTMGGQLDSRTMAAAAGRTAAGADTDNSSTDSTTNNTHRSRVVERSRARHQQQLLTHSLTHPLKWRRAAIDRWMEDGWMDGWRAEGSPAVCRMSATYPVLCCATRSLPSYRMYVHTYVSCHRVQSSTCTVLCVCVCLCMYVCPSSVAQAGLSALLIPSLLIHSASCRCHTSSSSGRTAPHTQYGPKHTQTHTPRSHSTQPLFA